MRLAALSTLAALSGLGIAQPDPTDIIETLTDLTTMCEDLMGPANQLTLLNAPLMLIGAGPWAAVVEGFTNIITTLDLAAAAAPSTGQFTGDDAVAVTDAFQTYSVAQTDLLDSIIDSVGQVGDTAPFFPPLEPVTTQLKAVSASANSLINKLAGSLSGGGEEADLGYVGELRGKLAETINALTL